MRRIQRPSYSEKEEEFDFEGLGDTVNGRLDFLGRSLDGTVNIRWGDKSRSRKSLL